MKRDLIDFHKISDLIEDSFKLIYEHKSRNNGDLDTKIPVE